MEQFTNLHSILAGMSSAMELTEPARKDYHMKVAYLAYHIAGDMGYQESDCRAQIVAAFLHGAANFLRESHYPVNMASLLETGKTMSRFIPLLRPVGILPTLSLPKWTPSAAKIPVSLLSDKIIRLAEKVVGEMNVSEQALKQGRRLTEMVQNSSDILPVIKDAFLRTARKEHIWMDLSYHPDLLTELLPDRTPVSLDETIDYTNMLSVLIDFRSPFTAMHSAGVAESAVCLSGFIGMNLSEQKEMRIAGYLHDLGKLKVPQQILEKNGKLTDDEYDLMKEHPYYTCQILKKIDGFGQIAQWAGLHHEKLNGKGYPFGYSADMIPLGARIMAVADVFSAITEDRPYRKGMEKSSAISVLRKDAEAGALSGNIVELLIQNYDSINQERDIASRKAGKRYYDSIDNTAAEREGT